MSSKLLPYGSHRNAALVTKVGSVNKASAQLLPYGDAGNSVLAAKVLVEGKFCNDPAARRVVRLNSSKR